MASIFDAGLSVMAFSFKMQKVLEYREQLEEEAKVRLASAQASLNEVQSRLAQLGEEIAKAEAQARDELMQNDAFWLAQQYIKGLRADISTCKLRKRLCEQLVEEYRQALAERAKERKLLEKLKERQKAQYLKEDLRQEQIFNDEIATVRYQAPAF